MARILTSAVALACVFGLQGVGFSPARPPSATPRGRAAEPSAAESSAAESSAAEPGAAGNFAVGKIAVRFTDSSRRVHFHGRHPEPRELVTVIRYPALGDPERVDVPAARPATASGPFPLVVFGHGFDSSPAIYARLLQAWTRAGYVVAAPVFPLSNEGAPGGADESDIVNQPADMSFVITRMLAADEAENGIFSRLIDPHEVAVAGQSDGAATALAAAYDGRYRDSRVDAAVILSGAEIMPGSYFQGRDPPLLATQGTADQINKPRYTYGFFRAAHTPKFLLRLLGARHIGPYTDEQPQLGVVERVTIAFLDRYLKRLPDARRRMWRDGDTPGVSTLTNGR